jgi:hypothetical protein
MAISFQVHEDSDIIAFVDYAQEQEGLLRQNRLSAKDSGEGDARYRRTMRPPCGLVKARDGTKRFVYADTFQKSLLGS